ncbi:hypothetical protein NDU88_006993 [Pleurodeles waltl]|uniref:Secreted protein n=1 Tax=Pleurodeles waltl TaxID=8319 RepID=A0AAV7VR64_PLEWA|nr:hypothetical protein NDU88_006993 [Pleurodeles waltl]
MSRLPCALCICPLVSSTPSGCPARLRPGRSAARAAHLFRDSPQSRGSHPWRPRGVEQEKPWGEPRGTRQAVRRHRTAHGAIG